MTWFIDIVGGLIVLLVVGYTVVVYAKLERPSNAPDKCKHRRWTKWKIEQLKAIHLYSQVDEGKDIPDRVDVYMTRECISCGLPQARTVRGIDSSHFK